MKNLTGVLVLAICLQTFVVFATISETTVTATAVTIGTSAESTLNENKATLMATTRLATVSDERSTTTLTSTPQAGKKSIEAITATSEATITTSSGWYVSCNCNHDFDPVCGTDGKTYSNACELQCISKHNTIHGYPQTTIHRHGECQRYTCNCPNIYSPVCGTDGISYQNSCYLNCEANRLQIMRLFPIKRAHNAICRRPLCCCSNLNIPVCGTDNLTYKNICVLQCSTRYHEALGKPAIHTLYKGACKEENCNSPSGHYPVCASDEKTYKNYHYLMCENRRRDHLSLEPLKIQYKGTCSNCRCPKIYDPVCSSNGVTYLNVCILSCENKRRISQLPPLLPLKYSRGVCTCSCPLKQEPVCASDHRTYNNRCMLQCENKKRSHLGWPLLAAIDLGQCPCRCGYCPRIYRPVCGSNGRTYWNICWLNCHSNCEDISQALYLQYPGPC